MSPETQALAFEQFYRAADARSAAPDGSGIGLYTARGLIGAMGGTISLSSALGAGTSIALVLPAELAHDDPRRGGVAGTKVRWQYGGPPGTLQGGAQGPLHMLRST